MNQFILGPKIGFVGHGIVGEVVCRSYDDIALKFIIDPNKGFNETWDKLKECEAIFICVPSPRSPDGSCDSSILEDVLSNLKDYTGVIISKVTATPDIYERLAEEYPNLVHVPEFLTAANPYRDYRMQTYVVIGGKIKAYQTEAERIIKHAKPDVQTHLCSIGEASLFKYIVNSFLATKVVFMNEMNQLAKEKNYNWSTIQRLLSMEPRIGMSHTFVPGPDGQYGFGGMCFPKDTSAILHYAKQLSVDLTVLSNAVKKNSLLRLKKPK